MSGGDFLFISFLCPVPGLLPVLLPSTRPVALGCRTRGAKGTRVSLTDNLAWDYQLCAGLCSLSTSPEQWKLNEIKIC